MFGGLCGDVGLGGWLLMVGLWAGFIGLVLWSVSRLFPSPDRHDEAAEALDRRLAVGDIDPATYRELRGELTLAGARRNQ